MYFKAVIANFGLAQAHGQHFGIPFRVLCFGLQFDYVFYLSG